MPLVARNNLFEKTLLIEITFDVKTKSPKRDYSSLKVVLLGASIFMSNNLVLAILDSSK